MGSYTTLAIGNLEVNWGKNEFFTNHSELFLRDDWRLVPPRSDEVPVEPKDGFARPLRGLVRRLEMLGYALEDCRRRYGENVEALGRYTDPELLSYDEFSGILRELSVSKLQRRSFNQDLVSQYVSNGFMSEATFTQLEPRLRSMSMDEGTFLDGVDPYLTLRLLAENHENLNELMVWDTGDVVEGGYVDEQDLYEGVPEEQVCLVVTEGSSDSTVLRESLPRLCPDLVDFFRFVDMKDNYPFTGVGNLYTFAKGLASIRVQNRILMILDNDTAGRGAYQRISALKLPPRMRVTTLPDLEECRKFATLGPSGRNEEDINGRAVSIEHFLDLKAAGVPDIAVRWSGYDEGLKSYQGEILHKAEHTKAFLEKMKRREDYDLSKLAILWRHLIDSCTRSGK